MLSNTKTFKSFMYYIVNGAGTGKTFGIQYLKLLFDQNWNTSVLQYTLEQLLQDLLPRCITKNLKQQLKYIITTPLIKASFYNILGEQPQKFKIELNILNHLVKILSHPDNRNFTPMVILQFLANPKFHIIHKVH